MKLADFFIGAIVWVSASHWVYANDSDIKQQREWFAQAEAEAEKGSYQTVEKWRQKLGDYPLFPYVELAYLKNHAFLSNKTRIRDFLSVYEGTPLDWPLRDKWLNYLAKQNKPLLYINDFKPTSDAELNCYYLRSELAIGAKVKSLSEQIKALWVVGKSQPKACDPLFDVWQKAGLRDTQTVKQRIVQAADGGSHTLIPYLTGLLPEKDQS